MTEGSRLKDQPAEERPRERLEIKGAEALKSSELIAILLRTGFKGTNAIQIAEQLLQNYQSLSSLSKASLDDLRKFKGIGRDKAVTLMAGFALARMMAKEMQLQAPLMDTPERVAEMLRDENRVYGVEQFQVLLLNTRRRLIRIERISQGTLDTILVHPRDVFRSAISANAAAVIIAHNHPSGDPTPSEADIKVTRDLIRAGQLLKIEVLDHIIMGLASVQRPQDYVSLRELGYFYT